MLSKWVKVLVFFGMCISSQPILSEQTDLEQAGEEHRLGLDLGGLGGVNIDLTGGTASANLNLGGLGGLDLNLGGTSLAQVCLDVLNQSGCCQGGTGTSGLSLGAILLGSQPATASLFVAGNSFGATETCRYRYDFFTFSPNVFTQEYKDIYVDFYTTLCSNAYLFMDNVSAAQAFMSNRFEQEKQSAAVFTGQNREIVGVWDMEQNRYFAFLHMSTSPQTTAYLIYSFCVALDSSPEAVDALRQTILPVLYTRYPSARFLFIPALKGATLEQSNIESINFVQENTTFSFSPFNASNADYLSYKHTK